LVDYRTYSEYFVNMPADETRAGLKVDLVLRYSAQAMTGIIHFLTEVKGGADSNWVEGNEFYIGF
jgi:hypothetical protein